MQKHEVGMDYLKNLQATTDRIAEDLTRHQIETGQEDKNGVVVVHETGRVFDKVLIGTINKDRSTSPMEVRFFVERSTGKVYGAKSPLAPNKRWFYGTIFNSQAWDWSTKYPTPKDEAKAGVEAVGKYGEATHYRELVTAILS